MLDTTRRRVLGAIGLGGTATLAGCPAESPQADGEGQAQQNTVTSETVTEAPKQVDVDQIAADPRDLPDPVDWDEPRTHEITMTYEEHTAEIEPGVTFDFMTFDGQIPGPMVRVRQGDTVELTVQNDGELPHNVDFHAIYGTGGGAVATTAAPGEENDMKFRADYPGAYIYHCAVPNLDMHISTGMFGMIVVEPEQGLPDVDQGDTVRVFLVTGGPNYSSNFHPIGNVWSRAYRGGGLPEDEDLEAYADKNIRTMKVPPGSCMIGEIETPVPERIKLVDHALNRVARKGMMAEVDVLGTEDEDIYDPDFHGSSHEGPQYGG
jgi:nitrite reductase (NO-forming)